jgi:hypothetical protein
VLVDRLRLRTGPGPDFEILARAFAGDLLELEAQGPECAWLLVRTAERQLGWVSNNPALLRFELPCNALPRSEVIVSPPTATPPPSPTRTHTATRTPTPSPTPVAPELSILPGLVFPRTPTAVPRLVARPTTAATELPSTRVFDFAPTPEPLAALAAGGPTSVRIIEPVSGFATRERVNFAWQADQPLAPGQLFEVAFWRPGEPPEFGLGWTSATTESFLSAKSYEQEPGEYEWGVWLGAMVDGAYTRLRYLGGGHALRVQPEPPPVEPGSGPPPNCPPGAPCRP